MSELAQSDSLVIDPLHHGGSNIRRRHLCKKVVFYWSALKPEDEMVSEASRGRYDLDKPENITDRYRQSNRTTWKNSVIRIPRKPLEPGLKLKIHLLVEFCHPSCDMNFADPREKSESLCIKPMTQRNLKHRAPSVRALVDICQRSSFTRREYLKCVAIVKD